MTELESIVEAVPETDDYPDDRFTGYAFSALELYAEKNSSKEDVETIIEIQKSLIPLDWDDVNALPKKSLQIILNALYEYQTNYKNELSIAIYGCMNSMKGDLNFWINR